MFCIKCGVELTDGQTICPVCGTRVYHPDFPVKDTSPTYPKKDFESEEFNRKGILFVVTILAVLAAALTVLFNISLEGGISWSGYVASGLGVFYVCVILPLWFKRTSPAIFVPAAFVSILLLLLYVNAKTGGGWFMSLAFPVAGVFGLIITTVTTLIYYLRRGYLYILGGGFVALGAWAALIELFIHLTFPNLPNHVTWSLFPGIAFAVFGMMLIIIAIVKPFRESLRKIFYVGKM